MFPKIHGNEAIHGSYDSSENQIFSIYFDIMQLLQHIVSERLACIKFSTIKRFANQNSVRKQVEAVARDTARGRSLQSRLSCNTAGGNRVPLWNLRTYSTSVCVTVTHWLQTYPERSSLTLAVC